MRCGLRGRSVVLAVVVVAGGLVSSPGSKLPFFGWFAGSRSEALTNPVPVEGPAMRRPPVVEGVQSPVGREEPAVGASV